MASGSQAERLLAATTRLSDQTSVVDLLRCIATDLFELVPASSSVRISLVEVGAGPDDDNMNNTRKADSGASEKSDDRRLLDEESRSMHGHHHSMGSSGGRSNTTNNNDDYEAEPLLEGDDFILENDKEGEESESDDEDDDDEEEESGSEKEISEDRSSTTSSSTSTASSAKRRSNKLPTRNKRSFMSSSTSFASSSSSSSPSLVRTTILARLSVKRPSSDLSSSSSSSSSSSTPQDQVVAFDSIEEVDDRIEQESLLSRACESITGPILSTVVSRPAETTITTTTSSSSSSNKNNNNANRLQSWRKDANNSYNTTTPSATITTTTPSSSLSTHVNTSTNPLTTVAVAVIRQLDGKTPVAIIEIELSSSTSTSASMITEDNNINSVISFYCRLASPTLERLLNTAATNKMRARTEQLMALTRRISAAGTTARLVHVVDAVLDASYTLLEASRVTLYLLDEQKENLLVASSRDAQARGVLIPIKSGLAGYAASTGRTVWVDDAYGDSRFNRSLDIATGFRTKSVIAAAILDANGEVIGVLQAVNRIVHAETPLGTSSQYPSLLKGAGGGGETEKSSSSNSSSNSNSNSSNTMTASGSAVASQMIRIPTSSSLSRTSPFSPPSPMLGGAASSSSSSSSSPGTPTASILKRNSSGTLKTLRIQSDSFRNENNMNSRRSSMAASSSTGSNTSNSDSTTTPSPIYPFVAADVDVLEGMAAHAAVALRSVQFLEETTRAKRTTAALMEIVQASAGAGSSSSSTSSSAFTTTNMSGDNHLHHMSSAMGVSMPSNSATSGVAVLVQRIIAAAYELLDCERVTLFLVDTVKKELWMAVTKDAESVGHIRIPIGKGLAGTVAFTGVPLNIEDAYEDVRFDPSLDIATGFRTQSVLVWPVSLSPYTAAAAGILRKSPSSTSLSSAAGSTGVSSFSSSISPSNDGPVGASSQRDGMSTLALAQHQQQQPPTSASAPIAVLQVINKRTHALNRAASMRLLRRRHHHNQNSSLKTAIAMASTEASSSSSSVSTSILSSIASSSSSTSTASSATPDHMTNSNHHVFDKNSNEGLQQPQQNQHHNHVKNIAAPPPSNVASHPTGTTARDRHGRFDANDEKAMSVFCAEVAVALKRRSAEATFLKALADSSAASLSSNINTMNGNNSNTNTSNHSMIISPSSFTGYFPTSARSLTLTPSSTGAGAVLPSTAENNYIAIAITNSNSNNNLNAASAGAVDGNSIGRSSSNNGSDVSDNNNTGAGRIRVPSTGSSFSVSEGVDASSSSQMSPDQQLLMLAASRSKSNRGSSSFSEEDRRNTNSNVIVEDVNVSLLSQYADADMSQRLQSHVLIRRQLSSSNGSSSSSSSGTSIAPLSVSVTSATSETAQDVGSAHTSFHETQFPLSNDEHTFDGGGGDGSSSSGNNISKGINVSSNNSSMYSNGSSSVSSSAMGGYASMGNLSVRAGGGNEEGKTGVMTITSPIVSPRSHLHHPHHQHHHHHHHSPHISYHSHPIQVIRSVTASSSSSSSSSPPGAGKSAVVTPRDAYTHALTRSATTPGNWSGFIPLSSAMTAGVARITSALPPLAPLSSSSSSTTSSVVDRNNHNYNNNNNASLGLLLDSADTNTNNNTSNAPSTSTGTRALIMNKSPSSTWDTIQQRPQSILHVDTDDDNSDLDEDDARAKLVRGISSSNISETSSNSETLFSNNNSSSKSLLQSPLVIDSDSNKEYSTDGSPYKTGGFAVATTATTATATTATTQEQQQPGFSNESAFETSPSGFTDAVETVVARVVHDYALASSYAATANAAAASTEGPASPTVAGDTSIDNTSSSSSILTVGANAPLLDSELASLRTWNWNVFEYSLSDSHKYVPAPYERATMSLVAVAGAQQKNIDGDTIKSSGIPYVGVTTEEDDKDKDNVTTPVKHGIASLIHSTPTTSCITTSRATAGLAADMAPYLRFLPPLDPVEGNNGESRLFSAIGSMFEQYSLLQHYSIPQERFSLFLSASRALYHPNPFHNWYHAVSVLHASFLLVGTTPVSTQCLTIQDIFATFIASLCHDIDHPGNNNAYEVALYTPLAITHNDDAVLERHHAATCWRLLLDPRIGLVAHLPPQEVRELRKITVNAILHTDMSKHFNTVSSLADRAARFQPTLTAYQQQVQQIQQQQRAAVSVTTITTPPMPKDLSSQSVITTTEEKRRAADDGEEEDAGIDDDGDDGAGSTAATAGSESEATTGGAKLKSSKKQAKQAKKNKQKQGRSPQGVSASSSPHTTPAPISESIEVLPLAPFPFDENSDADRQELVSLIVHTADLSGQAYPLHVSLNWSSRIMAEFETQAIAERAFGLTPAPFMAALDTPLQAARLQFSFVSNIVLPLWQRVAELIPGVHIPLANMVNGRDHYEKEVMRLEKEVANDLMG